MNILLVEDDGYKQERIQGLILEATPGADVVVAKSVRDAVAALQDRHFDHIFLDIALPSHTEKAGGGGSLPMPSGGVEILLELSFRNRQDPVTVITQYNEIEFDRCIYPISTAKKMLCLELGVNIRMVVHYEGDKSEWEKAAMRGLASDG